MKKNEKFHTAAAERLTETITRFFNIAYGRKIRGSRLLTDAIEDALDSNYTEDEIRIVYWIARCLTGKSSWLCEALRGNMLPNIVLRHHGRLNNVTGKEAVRWLDEMLARIPEANLPMIKSLWLSLPEEMKPEESALLERMGIKISD